MEFFLIYVGEIIRVRIELVRMRRKWSLEREKKLLGRWWCKRDSKVINEWYERIRLMIYLVYKERGGFLL